jgi:DNA-binding NarL/FixJ family response regulator
MDRRTRSKVFIVDEYSLVRELLRQLLDTQQDMVVCGTAEDAAQALTRIRTLKHSCAMDLIKDLQIQHPKLPILVLAMHDEPLFAERALRAGVSGYISKHETPDKLLSAIREVLERRMYVSERLANMILQRSLEKPKGGGNGSAPFGTLSDRELQVFELIGQGYATRQIATSLSLGMRTVNTYRSRIKEKLGVKDSAALMHQAIQWMAK